MTRKKGDSGNPITMWKKGICVNKAGRPKLIINTIMEDIIDKAKFKNEPNKILRKQDIKWLISFALSERQDTLKKIIKIKETPLALKIIVKKMIDPIYGADFTAKLIDFTYYKK